jgi:hypothetical protein
MRLIAGCSVPGEADDGSRTRDLELGKLALYQLSYVRAVADSTAGLLPGVGEF